MAVYKVLVALALFCAASHAQRPSFAGLRPIGYPELETNVLSNRFGEDSNLPIEAKGDGNLINRFNQIPVDNRPFWFINSQQYDELRKNPQTYQLRPNGFIDRNSGRR
ncbi:unnamed protein product [Danaus chrysippus]|uniref:(African queen) hypothetical protein n=1 Tax=Danaus chrysippus TaxID=151541 RepID=A0A8J2QKY4_9NEOP|nr:unnamed protein product [Danaus chrysippus]